MARTRYRWDAEALRLVEIGSDWAPTPRGQISVDRHYENLAMQDGEIVNSRRQHKEYMARKGLAVADDFKGAWAKQQQEREALRTGQHDTAARREAVGRAVYELEKRRR